MSASDDDGGSPLRRLDDAVVPRLQGAARAVVRFASGPLRGLRRWERRFAQGRPERFLWRHRQELVLVVALLMFAGSFVHLQRYPDRAAQADGGGSAAGPTAEPTPDDGPALAGGAVVVGPVEGQQLEGYITERREALADVPGGETRVAVVSFDDYLDGPDAAAVIPDALSPQVLQLRLPDPRMEPFEVDVDDGIEESVAEAIGQERERIAREETEFQELLDSGTVEDEDFVAEFREQLERLTALRNLLDTGAGTVFAVVVRGSGEELRALADREQVRLVDPAPAETELDASTYYGLLPDDEETVSFGGIS